MARDWLIWQIADSAFPAGGFAHSGGLEAALQSGLLSEPCGLRDVIRSALRQAAHGVAPFVADTCRDPGQFAHADQVADAVLSNHVANRASRLQGAAFLAAATRVFHDPGLDELAKLARPGSSPKPTLHFGPVFGVVAARLGIDVPTACSLFLFLSLRSLVSASVRLGIVGPLEAQTLQTALSSDADALVELSRSLSIDEVAQTLPMFDLAQANHDRLYSRLFQS